MEQGQATEKEGCCTKGKCCGVKALAAVALLAIGGVGGFLCGRGCPTGGGAAISAPTK